MSRPTNSDFKTSNRHGFFHKSNLSELNQTSKTEQLNGSFGALSSRNNNFKHNHNDCLNKEDAFAKTSSKLKDTNFAHHNPDSCICDQCLCKRHLCTFKVIKPNLTKNTIYQRSFYQQPLVQN